MRFLWMAVFLGAVLVPLPAQAEAIEFSHRPSQRPRLKSIYSVEHEINELKSEAGKGIVFIFLGVDCPVAQQYLPTLKELHKKYSSQGIKFYGVYPNARVHVRSMAEHAHDQDIPFPVFLDDDQKLATALEISVTPEVVLLTNEWERVYQGAIDNQYKKSGRIANATRFYLRDALEAMLKEEEVEPAFVTPSGCPLERFEELVSTEEVTYHKDVEPIIQANCQDCHRPGGVGPFSLLTYKDAYYSAERILEVVQERRMPPWHGFLNPEFGKLKNAKDLSDKEIETIVSWVNQGAEEGDPKDAPPARKFPAADAWEIGKPDYVYKIPPFNVPKHGILDYQFFRVKMRFPEDRWFSAVEVKPGNAEVVHHVGLHIVPASDETFEGFAGMAALYGFTTEDAVLVNDYVPGDTYNAKVYPEGKAVRIPKNTDLIFEVHYTPNNREATVDQSMVGFQWAKQPPTEEVLTKVFRKPIGRFRIPPHESHFKMEDTFYFKEDVVVDAIRPHFHYRGKSFRLEIVKRDPQTDEVVSRTPVLTVPLFDPDWQRTYELETPLKVPAGTELVAIGVFDNSELNPRNPDPTKTVLWGQQTTDEMFSVRFKYRRAADAK